MAVSEAQTPVFRIAEPYRETWGNLAVELGGGYGLRPDPWQRGILDDWLARTEVGWAHMSCGLAIPRQNGKNAVVELFELFHTVGLGAQILHTAHEVKTAREHFARLKHFFGEKEEDQGAAFPELNAQVSSVRNTNGQEAIFLKNGGAVRVSARSRGASRGFTVDIIVFDESQELSEDALEALAPTSSAAPLGDPQWVFIGTPPGPNSVGDAFSRVRKRAIKGEAKRATWSEWSPPSKSGARFPKDLRDTRLKDPALWKRVNPAIEAGRISLDFVRAERAQLSDEGFARERLGWWASEDATRRLITPSDWEDTVVTSLPEELRPDARPVLAFGIAFSRDGSRVAVAGALHSRRTGHTHVELVGDQSGPLGGGVSSIAGWLFERRDRASVAWVSGQAGAPALQAAMRELKAPRGLTYVASAADYYGACSVFLDAVRGRTVTHPAGRNEDALDRSVSVSDRKIRTNGGSWGWESTAEAGDEVPLEAASLALQAARTTRRRPGRKQRVLA